MIFRHWYYGGLKNTNIIYKFFVKIIKFYYQIKCSMCRFSECQLAYCTKYWEII